MYYSVHIPYSYGVPRTDATSLFPEEPHRTSLAPPWQRVMEDITEYIQPALYGVVRNEAVLSWPLIVAGSRAELVGALGQSDCSCRSSIC